MIELKDIVVKFDDFEALHGINVEVREGEFFTFLGPSGCGKTTTLRTITGFIEPVQGTVNVDGKDITHVPIENRNIGIVFQSYALFPTMTVYDNIAFGLKVKKLKKQEIDQKVREIARKVDLSDEQLKKAVSQLSGGQQQRVAIARALVTGPSIICMDEPLSNLDAKLRVQLRNELKKMQRDFGITTIYVTHDQEEALTLSDRIAVFNKGSIEQIGTPNEVYNHSATPFVCNFIGDINPLKGEVAAKLGLPADRQHFIRLERVRVNQPTLEGEAQLQGMVTGYEYYGLYIKYYVQVGDAVIKAVEKNDGVQPEIYWYRARVTKDAAVRFVSHLEYADVFVKAFDRAKLPMAYSSGFNPHMKLAFGSALAVGVSSEAEYMDFALKKPLAQPEVFDRLSAQLPPGVRVLALRPVRGKHVALMAQADAADYRVRVPLLGDPTAAAQAAQRALAAFRAAPEVFVTRVTPKKTRRKEIKQYLKGPLTVSLADGVLTLSLTTCIFKEAGSVKPGEILAVLVESFGLPVRVAEADIHRTALTGGGKDLIDLVG